ncbi:transcriptional regulator [Paenibacillus sp. SSG-1]|uniref:Transcriptional regulator n=2 Tax=Paenibacillus TaxID=44249 RepID=A0ABQ4LHM3_9BACL|nr:MULTISPECIES: metalloregulator ArsR/SmtB family transcription factor [Paenibacillus]MBJ9991994.1 winged helix-turn-helix transcriptional regulator [Paenibacillus sp. S28]MEC0175489.1 metalloregulator ArsR/SmtB family transcription factor [Paenibacillus favisporus]OXL86410.1 transcriptional regulator [Paenibacillus sp. SSG-1]PQP86908.1 ArsR family transcriptional regulator [Paenibacillus sp. AR247]RED34991.1 ArsR family transcriptional regulator [Paenibacillus sp. VMFN-D1]
MNTDKLFEALSEPNRRSILEYLRVRDRSVGELVELSSLSQPGVSKHLRILREAGLVTVRSDAQKRMYSLNAKPLEQLDDWLGPYRRFWSGKLDDLERFLDEEEP